MPTPVLHPRRPYTGSHIRAPAGRGALAQRPAAGGLCPLSPRATFTRGLAKIFCQALVHFAPRSSPEKAHSLPPLDCKRPCNGLRSLPPFLDVKDGAELNETNGLAFCRRFGVGGSRSAQGGRRQGAKRPKRAGPSPALWFGWPGGQRPPGRQTPPPPRVRPGLPAFLGRSAAQPTASPCRWAGR